MQSNLNVTNRLYLTSPVVIALGNGIKNLKAPFAWPLLGHAGLLPRFDDLNQSLSNTCNQAEGIYRTKGSGILEPCSICGPQFSGVVLVFSAKMYHPPKPSSPDK